MSENPREQEFPMNQYGNEADNYIRPYEENWRNGGFGIEHSLKMFDEGSKEAKTASRSQKGGITRAAR
jgi:hypothetical protein